MGPYTLAHVGTVKFATCVCNRSHYKVLGVLHYVYGSIKLSLQ